jgi:hypothetical protein
MEDVHVSMIGLSSISMDINIYPNPTAGIIQIQGDGVFNVSIVSVSGCEVFAARANDQIMVNLMKSAPGVYFVIIHHKGATIREKIILQ